jgi:hypothetical protein
MGGGVGEAPGLGGGQAAVDEAADGVDRLEGVAQRVQADPVDALVDRGGAAAAGRQLAADRVR